MECQYIKPYTALLYSFVTCKCSNMQWRQAVHTCMYSAVLSLCYSSCNASQSLKYSGSQRLDIVRYVGMQSACTYHLIPTTWKPNPIQYSSHYYNLQPGAHPASYTMGTMSFPGVKRPGRGVYHPPLSSAEVKERVELYLYSPAGSSWPVLGWTLPFTFTYYNLQTVADQMLAIRLTRQLRWHRWMNTVPRHSNTLYCSVLCIYITLAYRLCFWLLIKMKKYNLIL
jgi:ABC-type sugar transport system permease subunit